jgi:hypothetical protein
VVPVQPFHRSLKVVAALAPSGVWMVDRVVTTEAPPQRSLGGTDQFSLEGLGLLR